MEISEDMQLVHFDFNRLSHVTFFIIFSDFKPINIDFVFLCNFSTPFELHDDNYVLKAMKLGDESNDVCTEGGVGSSMSAMFQPRVPLPPLPRTATKPPPSPPLPGILKGRVKHEH